MPFSSFRSVAQLLSSFCLILAIAELALRLLGFSLQFATDSRNIVLPADSRKLRILTLGESTTADVLANNLESAWPRVLEQKLHAAGISARVYNEGVVATNSAMILSRLPEYLEKYRPHVVISMMGVNDIGGVSFDESSPSRIALFLNNLRISKVARWFGSRVEAALSQRLYFDALAPQNYYLINEGIALAKKSLPVNAVETAVRKRAPDLKDTDMALILTQIANHFSGDRHRNWDTKNASAFSARAFQLAPFQHDVAFNALLQAVQAQNWRSGAEKAHMLLQCGLNISEDILALMSKIAAHDPSLAAAKIFKQRNIRFENNSDRPTAAHYRQLFSKLQRKGVALIAMQYPTEPLEHLLDYFRREDGKSSLAGEIVFVANKTNFQEALAIYKYEDIFTDRFRGTWGHTTSLGHQLIAESARDAVAYLLRNW